MTIRNRNRKTIARNALVAIATGFAALALAPVASADLVAANIGVESCPEPRTQLCTPIPTVTIETTGPLFVEFEASKDHCADMIAHIFLDGREWGSNVVGPGQRDGGYFIMTTPGLHSIGVQAEGIEGGCNHGAVSGWAGRIHVESNEGALDGRN
jgi:hypothetical protein